MRNATYVPPKSIRERGSTCSLRHLLIFLEKSLSSWIMNNAFKAWWMHEVIIRRSGSLLTSFSFFQCSAKMFDVISRRHTRKVNLELSTCQKEALNALFIIHEFKNLPGDGTESSNPEWEFFSYILCTNWPKYFQKKKILLIPFQTG